MLRRVAVVFVLSLLVVAWVSAAGQAEKSSASAGPANITFWDMVWGPADSYPPAVSKVVDKFNSTHPGVNVKVQMIPWANYYQVFLTAVNSGSAPDVATTSSTLPYFYYKAGKAAPLNSILDQWKAAGTYNDIPQYAYDSYNFDGTQAAIPWNVDGRLFFYRKDVFDKLGLTPPKNWNDLLNDLRAIKAKTDLFPMVFSGGAGDQMLKHIGFTFQAMNNVGSVTTDLKPNMTDPRNIEVLQFFKTLAVEGLIPPGTLGYQEPDAERLYYDGKAAILYDSTTTVLLNYPDVASKSAVMPPFMGPSGDKPVTTAFVNPIMVFNQTKSLDASKSFVKWYSENNLPLWTEGKTTQFPVRASFLVQPYFKANWIVDQIGKEIVPNSRPGGTYPIIATGFPGWGQINGEAYIQVALQEILSQKQSANIQQIAKAMDEKIAQAIATGQKG